MDYPKRPSHFAHRVVRQLFKTCAAMEIGETAALLVIFVAHTEDAKRYSAPPNFFNDQLIPILGIRKWHTLDKARRAAVEAGWLHYEPGGTHKPGIYWTEIPERFAEIDDTPLGESIYPPHGDNPPSVCPPNGDNRGDNRGDNMGEHPTLCPDPSPDPSNSATTTPKRKHVAFQPPTLEEITAYCRERKSSIDPEEFLAHYASQGWVKSNGRPVKDWKLCIVTWEKNDRKRQPNATDQAEGFDDYAN